MNTIHQNPLKCALNLSLWIFFPANPLSPAMSRWFVFYANTLLFALCFVHINPEFIVVFSVRPEFMLVFIKPSIKFDATSRGFLSSLLLRFDMVWERRVSEMEIGCPAGYGSKRYFLPLPSDRQHSQSIAKNIIVKSRNCLFAVLLGLARVCVEKCWKNAVLPLPTCTRRFLFYFYFVELILIAKMFAICYFSFFFCCCLLSGGCFDVWGRVNGIGRDNVCSFATTATDNYRHTFV